MIDRPRIIDVLRKPRKCPVCGVREENKLEVGCNKFAFSIL